jgi:peptide/nickel transport system permease protein
MSAIAPNTSLGRHTEKASRLAGDLFHNPIVRVIFRRLVFAVPLLFVVSFLTFVLLSLSPGNEAYEILGSGATPQKVAALDHQLGLDLSLPVQYWHWLKHALSGNLGTSVFSGQPVAQTIGQRLPVTLSLLIGGLVLMPGIGVPLGIYSAVRSGVTARILDAVSLVGFSVPSFWVGAILIELFAVKLHWFPALGTIGTSPVEWLQSYTLPVIAVSLVGIAGFARFSRDAMLEVLASEHIRMARANGLPERSIIFRYALKNVGIRVVTLIGLFTISLLGGTIFVETVFALPGMGSFVVTGALQGDVPVVQGVVVVFTLIIVIVNLLVDLAYTLLDPRVRSA